ncbi:MAG TPA: VWA domain-containing protein, partial [Vicinamibacterales bacterium]|nr:VWA domain-containing protein [Vicinamibacterales bacterium]
MRLSLSRPCLALLAAVVTVAIPRAQAPAAQREAREREVTVSVVDGAGAPVDGLTPADFVVREDGAAREVLRVRRETRPLHLAVLVDNSQAAEPAIAEMRRGLDAFLEKLGPDHRLALATFGERPELLVDYTTDRAAFRQRGVQRLFARPGSGAYLLDAVVEASRGLERRRPERPAIVLLTTEGVEFSTLSHDSVLEALWRSGATLHAVIVTGLVEPDPSRPEARERNLLLDRGTATTGGRRDYVLAVTGIGPALVSLAAELESQYLVTYARPEALIPPERLEVEVRRPGATARARTRAQP